jgi:hypothetical protein
MTDHDAEQLELFVSAKHLRIRMVRTAIALGLTLVNLAKVEGSIGNLDRAGWASDAAKKVHHHLQECLPNTNLGGEDMQWAIQNLHELE